MKTAKIFRCIEDHLTGLSDGAIAGPCRSQAFGELIRNLHRWMAHGMVLTVLLHMMRVFYTGA